MRSSLRSNYPRLSGALALLSSICCLFAPAKAATDIYAGIEFDMPEVVAPTFPDHSVSIVDFGAVADGQTLNSAAIAQAIDAVSRNGGGRVIIPRGIWLTGPVRLKSNIDLHVEAGALLLFSPDKDLYPLILTSFEGLEAIRCTSPIYGKNLENVAITGTGTIDGSGDAWRMVKKGKMTADQWSALLESGGALNARGDIWYPSEAFMLADRKGGQVVTDLSQTEKLESIRDALRPVMVSLVSCKNVLLDGPVFQNSPAWCIHPLMCENLMVRNIDVRNPWYSQNGDGIDIESCKNAVVIDSRFDVGDDAICIKSGKNEDGRRRGMPTENLIVKNCIVYHGHGGFTVGSEMSGGVKNMHVSDCTFIGTDVGIRFKSNRGRGGIVEDVYISNINMTNIKTRAISFNLYYGGQSMSEMLADEKKGKKSAEVPVTVETPQFKNIYISGITLKGASQAIYLQGLPEMNLENVNLSQMLLHADTGLLAMDANGIRIQDLTLITKEQPAITLFNTQNVEMTGLVLPESSSDSISIQGPKTKSISIEASSTNAAKVRHSLSKEVDTREVQVN